MAGHSHWAGIKHKKAIVDAKKGKLFSKAARHIMSAARQGGGDPDLNLKLYYAIQEARAVNMPADNIERAIKKGTGELVGEAISECLYEGYAPGGVALLIEIMTDNRHRTAGEVRKIFDRKGGKLGESGCVAWMFEARGLLSFPAADVTEDRLLEAALEAGADDVRTEGDARVVSCDPKSLESVRASLAGAGLRPEKVQLIPVPQNRVPIEDEETARKVLDLCQELDDHDDVQNVYANFEIPEAVLGRLQGSE
mgnify:FL=1